MGEGKQVKVDNWGIFFLQCLQHFFNKTYFCDLTLQFNNNVQLKVHRLVLNACTEYFQVLEQTCVTMNDCLIMPANLQADVVVPIINFMYTGILEFQESIFDKLYAAAQLMNIAVLTKLLDAQKTPINPKAVNKRTPASPVTWNVQGKKITTMTEPDLPETLPGRKLPIWKRKFSQDYMGFRSLDAMKTSIKLNNSMGTKYFKSKTDEPPKPTRFEWPEEEEGPFESYSFDEISYTSKPLVQPTREKSPKPSTSTFEDIKRSTVAVKRASSPIGNQSKKVNIQDVKEYLKEQKLRSDYIDYDDTDTADNDFQSYNNDDDSGDDDKNDVFDENSDESTNKASKAEGKRPKPNGEGKENSKSNTSKNKTEQSSADMSNHTKIITEVLKKYPHLVKKNKNIRLKILAKGVSAAASSSPAKSPGIQVKVSKTSPGKLDCMMVKPDGKATDKEAGPYLCNACNEANPLQFDTYYAYRKHRSEVHMDKAETQVCDVCGHISRKHYMLLYHKYVKHNVPPPALYYFPKCRECGYIAPSAALFTKHQLDHTQGNRCTECNSTFQTKPALLNHVQATGHRPKADRARVCPLCDQKFCSQQALDKHTKKVHGDGKIEEYEELEVPQNPVQKHKEKIKILSDIKMNSPMGVGSLLPVRAAAALTPDQKLSQPEAGDASTLEPSSEAEALSNVASGIAASLGLVDTIVVLDDNQFIIQQQQPDQEHEEASQTEFMLPEILEQSADNQDGVGATDAGLLKQATLAKTGIASTDELVMVLTDHDYSDAANTAVIPSDNSNIVVLYSHPVQNSDTQYLTQQRNIIIGSKLSMINVDDNYTVTSSLPMEKCEESIEMIQQELNNHIEQEITTEVKTKPQDEELKEGAEQAGQEESQSQEVMINTDTEKSVELVQVEIVDENKNVQSESVEMETMETLETMETMETMETEARVKEEVAISENVAKTEVDQLNESLSDPPNTYSEPMELEESIELIQEELNKETFVENVSVAPDVSEEVSKDQTADKEMDEKPAEPPQKDDNCKLDEAATVKEKVVNSEETEQQEAIVQPDAFPVEEPMEVEDKSTNAPEETQPIAPEESEKLSGTLVEQLEVISNSNFETIECSDLEQQPNPATDEAIETNPVETAEEVVENIITEETRTKEVSENNTCTETVVSQDKLPSPQEESTQETNSTSVKEPQLIKSKISNLLDDWDDGDTDSQQSDLPKPVTDNSSINRLIDDWEDEEET